MLCSQGDSVLSDQRNDGHGDIQNDGRGQLQNNLYGIKRKYYAVAKVLLLINNYHRHQQH